MNPRMDEDEDKETIKDMPNIEHKEKYSLHSTNNFLRPLFDRKTNTITRIQPKKQELKNIHSKLHLLPHTYGIETR